MSQEPNCSSSPVSEPDCSSSPVSEPDYSLSPVSAWSFSLSRDFRNSSGSIATCSSSKYVCRKASFALIRLFGSYINILCSKSNPLSESILDLRNSSGLIVTGSSSKYLCRKASFALIRLFGSYINILCSKSNPLSESILCFNSLRNPLGAYSSNVMSPTNGKVLDLRNSSGLIVTGSLSKYLCRKASFALIRLFGSYINILCSKSKPLSE
ncbi:hypothetical protein SFRURICE_017961, partial [Spodoptera frugiperda]